MPGGDRTGPMGYGPRTGRGAGYCAGYAAAGYMNSIPGGGWIGRGNAWGRGRGSGRGFGRGWRNGYYAMGVPGWQGAAYGYPVYGRGPYSYPEPTVNEEKEMLKEEADVLKQELGSIQDRIQALEKTQKEETSDK